ERDVVGPRIGLEERRAVARRQEDRRRDERPGADLCVTDAATGGNHDRADVRVLLIVGKPGRRDSVGSADEDGAREERGHENFRHSASPLQSYKGWILADTRSYIFP